jgi:hypothetical protein
MKDKQVKKRSRVAKKERAKPLLKQKDIPKNPDPHIDQDFPGYPHAPAQKDLINPKTSNEKKVARVDVKDGEKMDKVEKKKNKNFDEQKSDGSANAFEGTEWVKDEEDIY